jgi:hypothetical protein
MDIRARLHDVAPVTAKQFAIFRIALGAYLAAHFAHLVPWGAELFSREGVLADAALNPTHEIFPNLLAAFDAPSFVVGFLLALVVCSLLFAAGIARRAMAMLLWYGWACLFNRNVLISNPGIPYIGLLLLLTTLVPPTEPYRVGRARRKEEVDEFYVPMLCWSTAWILMAVGYTFSGLVKLQSPSWVDGTALWHLLNNPLARPGWPRDLALAMPQSVIAIMTWGALALEVLFLPLAIWRRTRPLIWGAMVSMHIGIMTLVSFADLTAGMMMLHLFTYDPRWQLPQLRKPWSDYNIFVAHTRMQP